MRPLPPPPPPSSVLSRGKRWSTPPISSRAAHPLPLLSSFPPFLLLPLPLLPLLPLCRFPFVQSLLEALQRAAFLCGRVALLSSSSLSFLCAPFSFLSCRWRCLLCDSPCAYGFSSSAGLDCTERTLSYLLGEVARDPLPCCGWLPHRTKRR